MVAGLLTYVIVGFALILIVEGLLYALFTDPVRRLLTTLQTVPDRQLRSGGLLAVVVGVGILWVMRR